MTLTNNGGVAMLNVNGKVTATPCCGQLFMDGTQEQNLIATYRFITNMTATNCVGVSSTDSNLTISVAGYYYCAFNVSFEGGVQPEEYEFAVHVDGVEADNVEAQRKTSNNDIGSCGGNGLLYLPNGDEVVDLRGKSLDPAAAFDPNKVQLALHRLN